MKKILYSLAIIVLLCSFVLISFTEIVNAIKSGNAKEVAKYFDTTVEITLPGISSSYSKAQAEPVLRDFFNSNDAVSYTHLTLPTNREV